MIKRPMQIKIPVLWNDETFEKNEWGEINYLVGPNGTGKSLLAEQIKRVFNGNGYISRYLNAERLVGLEKQQEGRFGGGNLKQGFNITYFEDYKSRAENTGLSSSAFIILKQRLDIRIKIEALLSDIFGKTIRLSEEGGFLKPKMQSKSFGEEYNLSENECHGLKELITLLTFLYDPSKNVLILDEPELHLHPQFQSFFLEEIRKLAGDPLTNPNKKIFFIITHSPYFLDLQSLTDLKNILVCHYDKKPSFVTGLDENDEYILKKFLPRFNTHHKQFFFSPNPVFVEGYTDQQIISILFEKIGINIGASGSCVIDVGGKDELGVFYRLCKSLEINCRIIADLDALFRGKLRRVISAEEKANHYIQKRGIGESLASEIGDLESHLSDIAKNIMVTESDSEKLKKLKNKLSSFSPNETHSLRVSILQGIIRSRKEIESVLDSENQSKLNLILGRIQEIHKAFNSCNTFIFPKGEIEHYYTQSEIDYLNITNKDTWFHKEREYLLDESEVTTIKDQYAELISILKEAVPTIEIEIILHIKFEVFEWIHRVQTSVAKGEIKNGNDLKRNAKIDYKLYQQILEVKEINIEENSTFKCTIEILPILTGKRIKIEFNELTSAYNFEIQE